MKRYFLAGLLLLTLPALTSGQTLAGFTPTPDTHYYDFWEGDWQKLVDEKPDSLADRFQVRRGIHEASFQEQWLMVFPENRVVRAQALRAWDQTTGRWMYTWISDNGLYQVWEGKKVGNDWYIYRHFNINGDQYLSRQAWLPDGPDRLIRISEKSYDEGKTWQLRFREQYQRMKPAGSAGVRSR
ncbi:hypothetical protein [Larkinella soli]|uniref:hypothetical protein n=1 Tax=Larkinella soli TaxID=1770527 RepID=UPI000FFB58CD|nr:hypothetical protein [Larkinella soli]